MPKYKVIVDADEETGQDIHVKVKADGFGYDVDTHDLLFFDKNDQVVAAFNKSYWTRVVKLK